MDSKSMEQIRFSIGVVIAAVIGVWHGIPEVTQVLLWLMVTDVMLGTFIAWRDGQFSLEYAKRGAFTKAGYLLVLALFALMTPYALNYLGFNLVQSVTVILLPRELGSIVKNLAELGIVIPQAQAMLDKFSADKAGGIASDNEKISEVITRTGNSK